MDITSTDLQEFMKCYILAATHNERDRFEPWLTEYAKQRCKMFQEGIIWDFRTRFAHVVEEELYPCEAVAKKIGDLGSDDVKVEMIRYQMLDEETIMQVVKFADDMCLLFQKEEEGWKVVAMFRIVDSFSGKWSESLEKAREFYEKKEAEKVKIEEEDDDDYWGQYDVSEPEEIEESSKEVEQTEEEYFKQYDDVQIDADTGRKEEEKDKEEGENDQNHVHQHIKESIISLRKLALNSGMDSLEFGALIMSTLTDN